MELKKIKPGGGYATTRLDTLELPWKDNERNVSCIPRGIYKAKYNPDKDKVEVFDVPDRDHIQIHIGNSVKDIKGCILVGKTSDWDREYLYQSRQAFEMLKEVIGLEEFELEIVDELGITALEKVVDLQPGWKDLVKGSVEPLPVKEKQERTLPDVVHKPSKLDGVKRTAVLVLAIAGKIVNKKFQLGIDEYIDQFLLYGGVIAVGDAVRKSSPKHNGDEGIVYRVVRAIVTFIYSIFRGKYVGNKT